MYFVCTAAFFGTKEFPNCKEKEILPKCFMHQSLSYSASRTQNQILLILLKIRLWWTVEVGEEVGGENVLSPSREKELHLHLSFPMAYITLL